MTEMIQGRNGAAILMHSYTFREWPVDVAWEFAARCGYDGVELSTVHYDQDDLNGVGEMVEALKNKHGIPALAVSFGGDLLIRDARRWERNVQRMGAGIEALAGAGVKLINGSVGPLRNPQSDERSGSWLAQDWHYERVGEGLRRLLPVLEKHDALLTLEVHMHTLHDRASSMRQLLRLVGSPRVQANLDPGNMFATPGAEPPSRAVEMLRPHIGYLHLKNARQVGEHFDFSELLEEGNLDYSAILKAVRAHGINVPLCIEYCGRGDVRRAARRDIEYLRSLLNDLD